MTTYLDIVHILMDKVHSDIANLVDFHITDEADIIFDLIVLSNIVGTAFLFYKSANFFMMEYEFIRKKKI